MNCPNCHMYNRDDSSTCTHCGANLGWQQSGPRLVAVGQNRSGRNRSLPLLVGLFTLVLAVLVYLFVFTKPKPQSMVPVDPNSSESPETIQTARAQYSHEAVNSAAPGEEVDLDQYLQKGKLNIVDFYSQYCPPCRQIAPLLVRLQQKRSDIAVIKVDINRPGVVGIDWQSPLAQQYSLQSIPHFIVFDEEGNQTHQGREAYSYVISLLQQEDIMS